MTPTRSLLTALALLASIATSATSASAQTPPPVWAYPVPAPDFKPIPDDGIPRHVAGSSVTMSVTQTRDRFAAPDWHPDSHPKMPPIVATGRKPEILACGFCHRADCSGGPENANLTGLSADYMAQQLRDFKSGARKSSVPNRLAITLKTGIAKAITDEEIATATAYFATFPARSNVTVIEAATVPETYVAGTYVAKKPNGGTEPIGSRIVEFPEDFDQFENRDTNARFIAYVPPGSIARGRDLATSGANGTTIACATCHGETLKGAGPIPQLAGRSPSYLTRQLHDFKSTNRNGEAAALMKPTVENLTPPDIIALAAYLASLAP